MPPAAEAFSIIEARAPGRGVIYRRGVTTEDVKVRRAEASSRLNPRALPWWREYSRVPETIVSGVPHTYITPLPSPPTPAVRTPTYPLDLKSTPKATTTPLL